MLKRIDRVQIAVPDRAAAVERWATLSGAEMAGEDPVAALGARCSCLHPGSTGVPGLRAVLSTEEILPSVGAIDFLYEATLLIDDPTAAVACCAYIFTLDADIFVPIGSEEFGYDGSLTLFRPNQLFRFEFITPTDAEKTLGRFYARTGPSHYMSFAEC